MVLFLLPLALAAPLAAQQFVGSEVCRTCHPNVWMNFYKNPHFRTLATGAEPPERAGCEGCHGPGSKHVEARGGKETIPRPFSLMGPKETIEACLECHGRDLPRANIRRSEHTLAEISCAGCHSIHRSPVAKFLLARPQTELCYTCHAPVRAQFSMPFKHRVHEGTVKCTDCHNPHGAFAPTWRMGLRPRMVEPALGNEQPCLKCHSDLRGPFLFEHAGVRVDGCEMCHSPHGSINAKLLRRPTVHLVCLECHSGAGNFGREGDGITLQSPSHNMADPKFRNCTMCHTRIHGSNSDARFLR